MRILVLCLALFISLASYAQRECASHNYSQALRNSDPAIAKALDAAAAFNGRVELAAGANRESGTISEPVIRIPVVVHVLYNTASQNIPDAQIKSQIEALNRDFRRKNFDTANTPNRFKSIAADISIEFVLATADPKGMATSGIVRKATTVSNWTSDDKIKFAAQGGDDAWDSKSYLNIWVGNMRSLLGYSSAPGCPANRDGLVIATAAFGTMNISSSFNMGRTAVHEAGHWLGLKHTWGDTYCGDDGVDDTPKQGNYTTGCPSGFRTSCSNGSLGDMYMNYMDFTNDACLNLFTKGQKEKMRTQFTMGGSRARMLVSKGLSAPWEIGYTEAAAAESTPVTNAAISTYPNPAKSFIILNTGTETWIGRSVRILNVSGAVIKQVIISSRSQRIDIAALSPGAYIIQGEAGGQKMTQRFVKL